MTPYATVWALANYLGSTSARRCALELFPGRDVIYIENWTERFSQGLPSAVGAMDSETFRRFVKLALANYGEEASKRFPK